MPAVAERNRSLELLLEADRRGILPEGKLGLLDEALKRGLVPFDPEGSGFDYGSAESRGITRDPVSQHFQSAAPLAPEESEALGLPPDTSRILKGRRHETFQEEVEASRGLGREIVQGPDGNYYSVPVQPDIALQKEAPPTMRQRLMDTLAQKGGEGGAMLAEALQPPDVGGGPGQEEAFLEQDPLISSLADIMTVTPPGDTEEFDAATLPEGYPEAIGGILGQAAIGVAGANVSTAQGLAEVFGVDLKTLEEIDLGADPEGVLEETARTAGSFMGDIPLMVGLGKAVYAIPGLSALPPNVISNGIKHGLIFMGIHQAKAGRDIEKKELATSFATGFLLGFPLSMPNLPARVATSGGLGATIGFVAGEEPQQILHRGLSTAFLGAIGRRQPLADIRVDRAPRAKRVRTKPLTEAQRAEVAKEVKEVKPAEEPEPDIRLEKRAPAKPAPKVEVPTREEVLARREEGKARRERTEEARAKASAAVAKAKVEGRDVPTPKDRPKVKPLVRKKPAEKKPLLRKEAEVGIPSTFAGETPTKESTQRDLKSGRFARAIQRGGITPEGAIAQIERFGLKVPEGLRKIAEPVTAPKKPLLKKAKPLQGEAGKKTKAFDSKGREYEFRFRVVEANELITSHTDLLGVNPRYPQELQPRERSRAASKAQVAELSQKLRPELLTADTQALDTGTPIVGPDSIVESGNARIIAARRAYRGHSDFEERMKSHLVERAKGLGLDPKKVQAMKRPILVRERLSEVDRVKFVQRANEPPVARFSAPEQAKSDAAKITTEQIANMPSIEGSARELILSPLNREFVRSFIGELPTAEQGELLDASGKLSERGVQRIQAALFERLYGSDLTPILSELTDVNIKNIMEGLLGASGRVARAKGLLDKGDRLKELDITKDLVRVVRLISETRRKGLKLKDALAQKDFFGAELTSFQKTLAEELQKRSRSRKDIRELVENYHKLVEESPHPDQEALFGAEKLTKEDLFKRALKRRVTEELFPATEKGPKRLLRRKAEIPPVRGGQDPKEVTRALTGKIEGATHIRHLENILIKHREAIESLPQEDQEILEYIINLKEEQLGGRLVETKEKEAEFEKLSAEDRQLAKDLDIDIIDPADIPLLEHDIIEKLKEMDKLVDGSEFKELSTKPKPIGIYRKLFRAKRRSVGDDAMLIAVRHKAARDRELAKFGGQLRTILHPWKPSLIDAIEKKRLVKRQGIYDWMDGKNVDLDPAQLEAVPKMRKLFDEMGKFYGQKIVKHYAPRRRGTFPDAVAREFAPDEIVNIHRLERTGQMEDVQRDIWTAALGYIRTNANEKHVNPMLIEMAPFLNKLDASRRQIADDWINHQILGVPTETQKALNTSVKKLGKIAGLNLSDRAYQALTQRFMVLHMTGTIAWRLKMVTRNAAQNSLTGVYSGFGNLIKANSMRNTPEGREILEKSAALKARENFYIENQEDQAPAGWDKKIFDVGMTLYRGIDKINVKNSFLAEWINKKGLDETERIRAADLAVANTQYLYGLDMPGIMTGAGKPAFAYWSWPLFFTDFVIGLAEAKNTAAFGRLAAVTVMFWLLKETTGIDWMGSTAFGPTANLLRGRFGPIAAGTFYALRAAGELYLGNTKKAERELKTAWRTLKPAVPFIGWLAFKDLEAVSKGKVKKVLFHTEREAKPPDKKRLIQRRSTRLPPARRLIGRRRSIGPKRRAIGGTRKRRLIRR
ncbi:hypothetical protein LCGC14_0485710 [marine sediment metagenome]|uniref:DdrB-like domain-containing protein n=1 Tax=marine sediment metagenome TaxID=412755 RepID=A0A0F9SDA4_9ZZZZ